MRRSASSEELPESTVISGNFMLYFIEYRSGKRRFLLPHIAASPRLPDIGTKSCFSIVTAVIETAVGAGAGNPQTVTFVECEVRGTLSPVRTYISKTTTKSRQHSIDRHFEATASPEPLETQIILSITGVLVIFPQIM
jgi:hypothetical protein